MRCHFFGELLGQNEVFVQYITMNSVLVPTVIPDWPLYFPHACHSLAGLVSPAVLPSHSCASDPALSGTFPPLPAACSTEELVPAHSTAQWGGGSRRRLRTALGRHCSHVPDEHSCALARTVMLWAPLL